MAAYLDGDCDRGALDIAMREAREYMDEKPYATESWALSGDPRDYQKVVHGIEEALNHERGGDRMALLSLTRLPGLHPHRTDGDCVMMADYWPLREIAKLRSL